MSQSTQLEEYERTYREAQERARAIAGSLTQVQFNWKPAGDRWSVGECLHHCNIVSRGYLPVLTQAIESAPPGESSSLRYGWLSRKFIAAVTPGTKPVSTAGSMKPPPAEASRSSLEMDDTLRSFEELMEQFADLVRRAEGKELVRTKVRSPFLWLLRLPAGAFLEALGLHALRHLDQAHRVTKEEAFPDAAENNA